MSNFEQAPVRNPLGRTLTRTSLGSPPGVSLDSGMLELLEGIVGQLNLASLGISTSWAVRKSDLKWEEIDNPDTNIQTFIVRDVDLLQAQQLMFGQPIPFLVIKTLDPVPRTMLEQALKNSPYEFFQTQAVYRQDDPNPIPRIEFHNWVKRRPLDREGSKPMKTVSDQVNGDLLFGQQVPVEGTTIRQKPAIPFQQAFDAQFLVDLPIPGQPQLPGQPFPEVPNLPGPFPEVPSVPLPQEPPVETTPPEDPGEERSPTTPSSPAQMPFWGPLLVAGAVATATVVLWKGARKR